VLPVFLSQTQQRHFQNYGLITKYCVFNMAQKEATVYIVDLGNSMGEKHNGREISDLDWALTYVWDKITTTVGRAVIA
jgi:hypothetical protein